MKRFVINAVLLLTLSLVLDFGIGKALKYMYFANTSGAPGYVLNHAVSQPYDAYIMGASGAQRGYIPSVISRELGMEVLNTGEAGTNIFHNYATLKLVLKHRTPKLIIWDLTDADYFYRPDAGKTGMITPYHHDPDIKELLYDLDPLNKLWLCSKIYPYNGKILSIVSSYVSKPNAQAAGDKGYHPIDGSINLKMKSQYLRQFSEEQSYIKHRSIDEATKDALIRKYFHAFIQLCRDNNVRLIAFHCPKAPLNSQIASTPLISEELRAQLQHYNIPLYSIMPSQYPEMNNLSLYFDFSHLNHSGAQVYSRIIAEHIKSELK